MVKRIGAAVLATCLLLSAACRRESTPQGTSTAAALNAQTGEWFVERAKETGLDFMHFNGMSGEVYYPEIMAPGAAVFDYDNAGDLDV